MQSVNQMNAMGTGWIQNVIQDGRQPSAFRLGGELGFRTQRCIRRIASELPYSREYILSQISGAPDQWSNFRKFHGDIAGRWILAMTHAHAGAATPPEHLRAIVDDVLALQNADGTFGCVQHHDTLPNMHKAYGNGWLLKGLAVFAQTFGHACAAHAAATLGQWYARTFHIWTAGTRSERDAGGNYAVSRSCYFHALDGLVSLFRLTGDHAVLDLAGAFIPHLTPLQAADHAHMYLTCRRGALEYYIVKNDAAGIARLADELRCFADTFVLETGGVPERLEHDERKRQDPERIFTDEACADLDWLLLCLRLHDVTGVGRWRDLALLNLENQIFYNQQDNGGFGDSAFGPYYPRFQKEAPWCCSLFGPFGLLSAAALLVRREHNAVVLYAPLTGSFKFADGTALQVTRDDQRQVLCLDIRPGPGVAQCSLKLPFWLQANTTEFSVNGTLQVEVPFAYRLWCAHPRREPTPCATVAADSPHTLFYGPWLLAHRFHAPLPAVHAAVDRDGFIQEFAADTIRGLGQYGQSVRIRMPSDFTADAHDVALYPHQHTGELFLYPLKDKEVVWRAWTRVTMRPPASDHILQAALAARAPRSSAPHG